MVAPLVEVMSYGLKALSRVEYTTPQFNRIIPRHTSTNATSSMRVTA